MPQGRLVIEDGEDIFEFGQSVHEANLEARMIIDDQIAYSDIAFGGSIGAAAAFMLTKWHSPNLVDLSDVNQHRLPE